MAAHARVGIKSEDFNQGQVNWLIRSGQFANKAELIAAAVDQELKQYGMKSQANKHKERLPERNQLIPDIDLEIRYRVSVELDLKMRT